MDRPHLSSGEGAFPAPHPVGQPAPSESCRPPFAVLPGIEPATPAASDLSTALCGERVRPEPIQPAPALRATSHVDGASHRRPPYQVSLRLALGRGSRRGRLMTRGCVRGPAPLSSGEGPPPWPPGRGRAGLGERFRRLPCSPGSTHAASGSGCAPVRATGKASSRFPVGALGRTLRCLSLLVTGPGITSERPR